MNISILYQSLEGHTATIVRHIRGRLAAAGHAVNAIDLSDDLARVDLKGVDRVILAAPVHERRHPGNFEVAIAAAKAEIMARPTLLLSVSLRAAFPEGMEDARAYIDELLMRTGLSGIETEPVAGAVREGSYDYFESQVLRHVVFHDRNFEMTGKVQVFTDWDAVCARVDALVAG